MIIPPSLHHGDTIGLICPAGYMQFEKMATCINILEEWGYKIKKGKTCGNQFHYFSGTDEERLEDLQSMIDDKEVKAILCARGGYGISRIIDAIDFAALLEDPKWIVGYSDVTLLLLHLASKYQIASLHAPMAAAFNDGGYNSQYVLSLKNSLSGIPYSYYVGATEKNRNGKASGKLIGGNLALFAHALGSESEPDTAGCILFLEDIGEYLYNIDRMMWQLKRAGKLDYLAGIIFGSFTDLKDTTIPFGSDIYNIIWEKVKEYDYPVCFDFPVGHTNLNFALKTGTPHSLVVSSQAVVLQEVA